MADANSVIASVTVLQHRHNQNSFKLMTLGNASDIANHPSTLVSWVGFKSFVELSAWITCYKTDSDITSNVVVAVELFKILLLREVF